MREQKAFYEAVRRWFNHAMDPLLSLERFAAVSAELDSGAPRDKVLQREGIALEAWTSAQKAWLAKLAGEVFCNRFELTNRYNAAFLARRKALEDGEKRPKRKRAGPARGLASGPAVVVPVVISPRGSCTRPRMNRGATR